MKSYKCAGDSRLRFGPKTNVSMLVLLLTLVCCCSQGVAAQEGGRGGFTDADVPLVVPTPTPEAEKQKEVAAKAEGGVKATPAVGSARVGGGRGRLTLTAYTRVAAADDEVVSLVREIAPVYRVDPELVFCLMDKESRFKRKAVSPAGARGLMQLMPGTAARFGVGDIFDARQNITGGIKYLRVLMNLFGEDRLDLVLAGYNAGEGNVIKYGRRVPPFGETIDYVKVITGRYGSFVHRNPAEVAN